MTENDKKNSNSKTLSLRGTGGSVRMNLSHGRSKSVLIETKRKKIILPNRNKLSKTEKEADTNKNDITKENNKKVFSDEQIDRRKKAIEAAREREIQIKEEQEKLKNKKLLDTKTINNKENNNKKVLEEISFTASDGKESDINVDREYIKKQLKDVYVDKDLSKFIL